MIRILLVMLAVMMVSGCERKGPMERTGERLDEIGENSKEGDSLLKKRGAMEKAGEAIDDSIDGKKK
jgi:hypothetical protein